MNEKNKTNIMWFQKGKNKAIKYQKWEISVLVDFVDVSLIFTKKGILYYVGLAICIISNESVAVKCKKIVHFEM